MTQNIQLGQAWIVSNRTEKYAAEVIGQVGDRVQIRRICPTGMTAKPTLALRSMFTNQDGGYLLAEGVNP